MKYNTKHTHDNHIQEIPVELFRFCPNSSEAHLTYKKQIWNHMLAMIVI